MDSKIRNICFIAIFTAMIAVCAQITIPMPMGVPFTLQNFAVLLAGIVLGAKKSTLSAIIYIMLGIIGVPVFAGFKGGFVVILGPTGGFIVSFPLMALCAGIFSDISSNKKCMVQSFLIAAGLILGVAIHYICGVFILSMVTSSSLKNAFIVVLLFIPLDIIKMILSGIIGMTVKKILAKNKIL